jgi:hypothetical protein
MKLIASVITAIGKLDHYNEFLSRYYENIQKQTIFDQLEVIIVYMEWHSIFDEMSKNKNFKFILDDQGKGMYNAWNIGIKHASTSYITNWNIDDLRFYNNIELKVNLLEQNPELDLIYNYYTVSTDINESFENFNYKNKTVEAYPDEAHKYVHQCCMCGPDPLWRRKIHEKIGYFDHKNYPSIADWEMWIRMSVNGCKFKLIPEILCLFFESPNSVSNKSTNIREQKEKPQLYEQYIKGFKSQQPTIRWNKISISEDKKLSILILSLNRRKHYLERLMDILNPQKRNDIEILTNIDNGEKSIGQKRNELLSQSIGDYICFIDDDDIVSNNYVELILNAIEKNPDTIGIHLLHKEDGILRGLTYHSLKYTSWWDEINKENPTLRNYYRNPNHLNPVKREYALKVGFPEINNGEDKWYSQNILQYLKTEEYIEPPIYEYLVRTQKEC